jgi:putative two-component system response regulator
MIRRPSRHPAVALIGEEEAGLLAVLKALLIEVAQVHVITTAPEFVLSLLETTTPGVVVLDLHLPEQRSWELLATLRQQPRYHTLPVVVFTTRGAAAERIAALNDPWIELFLKPLDLEEVLQRIQHLVQQPTNAPREARPGKN